MSKRKAAKKSNKKLNFLKKLFSFKKSSLLAALAAIFIVAAAAFAGSQGTRENVTNGFYKTLAGLGFDVAVPEVSVISDCGTYSDFPELCSATKGCTYEGGKKTVKCDENDCTGANKKKECTWKVDNKGACTGSSLCKQQDDFSACVETAGCKWENAAGYCDGQYQVDIPGKCVGKPLAPPDPEKINPPNTDPESKVRCADKNDKLTIPEGGPYFFQTGICAYCVASKNGGNEGVWKKYNADQYPKFCENTYNPKNGQNKMCPKNGLQYPTGTVIGKDRCKSNGEWEQPEKCPPNPSCNDGKITRCNSDRYGFKIDEKTTNCPSGKCQSKTACADKPNDPPPAPEKDCSSTFKNGTTVCKTETANISDYKECVDGEIKTQFCGKDKKCKQSSLTKIECESTSTYTCRPGRDGKWIATNTTTKKTETCEGECSTTEGCLPVDDLFVCTMGRDGKPVARNKATGEITACPDKCNSTKGCYSDEPGQIRICNRDELRCSPDGKGVDICITNEKENAWVLKIPCPDGLQCDPKAGPGGTPYCVDKRVSLDPNAPCNGIDDNRCVSGYACQQSGGKFTCRPKKGCTIGEANRCSQNGNVEYCGFANSSNTWLIKEHCDYGCDYTGQDKAAKCKPRPTSLNTGDKCDGPEDNRCPGGKGGCTWKLFAGYTCDQKKADVNSYPTLNDCKTALKQGETCVPAGDKWTRVLIEGLNCGNNISLCPSGYVCAADGIGKPKQCHKSQDIPAGQKCDGPNNNASCASLDCRYYSSTGWVCVDENGNLPPKEQPELPKIDSCTTPKTLEGKLFTKDVSCCKYNGVNVSEKYGGSAYLGFTLYQCLNSDGSYGNKKKTDEKCWWDSACLSNDCRWTLGIAGAPTKACNGPDSAIFCTKGDLKCEGDMIKLCGNGTWSVNQKNCARTNQTCGKNASGKIDCI
ncbi:MAG: hypothetical protein UY18_C0015G0011 [Microgenomates group bacterium GW2011_GWF2_47_9]|nr:MAG: hypothetical protein UY18_C0015G0011 [Microgenomates group bacterium GW2011_GWF2_47_9]